MVMIFKGIEFVRSHTLVDLPVKDEDGNQMPYIEKGKENYLMFGKIFKAGSGKRGAVKTNYFIRDENGTKEPIFAVPVALKYHSLTNMMVGQDGYYYLCLSGRFYKSKKKIKSMREAQ